MPLVLVLCHCNGLGPKKDSCKDAARVNFNKTPLFATTRRQFPREAQQHYRLTYLSRSPPVTVSWLKSFSCHDIGRTAVTQCPTTNGTFRLIRGWKREFATRTWNHPTKISYSPKSITIR